MARFSPLLDPHNCSVSLRSSHWRWNLFPPHLESGPDFVLVWTNIVCRTWGRYQSESQENLCSCPLFGSPVFVMRANRSQQPGGWEAMRSRDESASPPSQLYQSAVTINTPPRRATVNRDEWGPCSDQQNSQWAWRLTRNEKWLVFCVARYGGTLLWNDS